MADTKESCLQYIPLLDAYRDGELDGEEKGRVQKHLDGCAQCSNRVDQINRLVAVMKDLPVITAPRDYAHDIESILSKSPGVKTSNNVVSIESAKSVRKQPIIWVAAVAASMLLTFGALQLFNNPAGQQVAVMPSSATRSVTNNNEAIGHKAPEPSADFAKNETTPQRVAQSPSVSKHESGHADLVANLKAPTASAGQKALDVQQKNSRDGVEPAASEDESAGHAVVAYYEQEQTTIPEALGISTDEDGLYAIKM